jgi:short-subunit dehydrogenase
MKLKIDGATALVTGASSGIGRAIARRLAPKLKAIVLVARRRDRLEELRVEFAKDCPGLIVHIETCDLADRPATLRMLESVDSKAGAVDILVNSAGLGNFALFDRARWEDLEHMLLLNVNSLVLLCRHFVPGMIERKRGGIMNVSSLFGMTYLPGFASYVGTKHFVTGFTEALRTEVAGAGVVVSQLCPGPVATEFEQKAGDMEIFSPPMFLQFSAEACARVAVSAFQRGRAIIIPGIVMKSVNLIVKLAPRWVTRAVLTPFGGFLRRKRAREELRARSVRA